MMPVRDLLRFKVEKNIAVGHAGQSVKEVLDQAAQYPRRCGAILVAHEQSQVLAGILTDGDLRRLLIERGTSLLNSRVSEVMTKQPTSVPADAPVRDAIQIIREKRIDELPVVDEQGIAVGVLDVQDLLAMKLIEED